mgnify:CR=1 FL=1
MARRRIIAGNWKMNKTPSEAVALVKELAPLVKNDDVDVVYCVPAIDIVPVAEAVKGSNVHVGAENFYIEDKGAFTGEISAPKLMPPRSISSSSSSLSFSDCSASVSGSRISTSSCDLNGFLIFGQFIHCHLPFSGKYLHRLYGNSTAAHERKHGQQ